MQSCRIFWRRFGACLVFVSLTLFFACRQNMAQGSSSYPKRDINAVLAAHDKELLAIPGVVGVYVGTLEDRRTPCLRVMLARKTAESRKVPQSIEGYPVITEVTGEIRSATLRRADGCRLTRLLNETRLRYFAYDNSGVRTRLTVSVRTLTSRIGRQRAQHQYCFHLSFFPERERL